MNLSSTHIQVVLGIPTYTPGKTVLTETLYSNILTEQIFYENFIDSIKNFVGDKYNQAVATIKDWKDMAVVFSRLTTNADILKTFLTNLEKHFKTTVDRLTQALKKLGLDKIIKFIEDSLNKLQGFQGWKKALLLTGIGSIIYYIQTKLLRDITVDKLSDFIMNHLGGAFLKKIIDSLADWKTFLGVLQPVVSAVEVVYDFIKEPLKNAAPIRELFYMKKEAVAAVITSLVAEVIKENSLKKEETSLEGSLGTLTNSLKKLNLPGVNPQDVARILGLVKQGKALNTKANKILADVLVGLIKSDDMNSLNAVFRSFKQIKSEKEAN